MVKLSKVTDMTAEQKAVAKWKKLKHDEGNLDCLHCKMAEAEDSIPTEEFDVKDDLGNPRTIKEITVVRGRYGDCIGWTF